MWGNSTDINKGFIAQKKCIRAICGVPPDESCRALFKNLDLLTLPSLYIYEVSKFVNENKDLFKIKSDLSLRPQRNANRLVYEEVPNSSKYGKSCLTMCVKIYNTIPCEFKSLSKHLFKKKLYQWLCDKNFYDIKDLFNINY